MTPEEVKRQAVAEGLALVPAYNKTGFKAVSRNSSNVRPFKARHMIRAMLVGLASVVCMVGD